MIGPDEDDSEDWGGPPPELVDRTWRHPSEIATAARLAAELDRSRRQRRRALALTATGGLVVGCGAAVLGAQVLERRPTAAIDITLAIDEPDAPDTTGREVAAFASAAVLGDDATPATDVAGEPIEATATDAATTVAGMTIDHDDAAGSGAGIVHRDDAGALAVVRLDGATLTCVQVTDRHAAMALPDLELEVGMELEIDRNVDADADASLVITHIDRRRSIVVLAGRAAEPVRPASVGLGDTVVSFAPDGLREGEVIDTAARLDGAHGPIDGALLTNITALADHHEPVVVDRSGRIVGLTLDTEHTLVAALPLDVVARLVETLETDREDPGWIVEPVEGRLVATEVAPDGPAALAGVLVGDVVEFVDGHRVTSLLELADHLATEYPIEVVVRRDTGAAKLTRHRLLLEIPPTTDDDPAT